MHQSISQERTRQSRLQVFPLRMATAACQLPVKGIMLPGMGKKAADKLPLRGRKSPKRAIAPARTSMADALFSVTQQRVFSLLFGQPQRSFFTSELIALAGGGSGAVQRELRRLDDSGLITSSRVGNQKHYQANADSPIHVELCGIVRKMMGPAEVIREALRPLTAQLSLALVYGSVAKRSDTAHSDIDVLLVSDSLTLEQVYAALQPAEHRLGRSVSPTLYTQTEFRRRQKTANSFVAKLLAGDHVPLTGGSDAFIAAG
jgi:predicted nucleotidyltransferase